MFIQVLIISVLSIYAYNLFAVLLCRGNVVSDIYQRSLLQMLHLSIPSK